MFRRLTAFSAVPCSEAIRSGIQWAGRSQADAAASAASTPDATEAPLSRPVSRYRVKRKAQTSQVSMKSTAGTDATETATSSAAASSSDAGKYVGSSAPKSSIPLTTEKQVSGNGKERKSLWGGKASSCAEESAAPVKPLSALQRRMAAMADKPKFSLTPNALYRIKTLLQLRTPEAGETENDIPIGIRVGIKKRGCSGLSYTVNYEPKENPTKRRAGDAVIEQGGIYVYVDEDALFYVIGTKMDFTVSQVEEKFTFLNPNERESCGCGESFQPFDA